jgi:hypothetical protein
VRTISFTRERRTSPPSSRIPLFLSCRRAVDEVGQDHGVSATAARAFYQTRE